jgi:hypothetical protein
MWWGLSAGEVVGDDLADAGERVDPLGDQQVDEVSADSSRMTRPRCCIRDR